MEQYNHFSGNRRKDQNCIESLLFTNIYSLMKVAQNQPLQEEMMDYLTDSSKSLYQHSEFQKFKNSHPAQKNLSQLLLRFFKIPLLKVLLIQFFLIASSASMPILIKESLEYISRPAKTSEEGILLLVLILMIRLINMITTSHSKLFIKIAGYDAMSLLSLEIMNKCLRVSLLSNTNKTSGEITNLMQVDVQKITLASNNLANLATIPLSIGFSLFYIYNQIGVSVIASVIIMILSMVQHKYLGKQIISSQGLVLKAKDKRAKQASEAFSQIRFIKINALEDIFAKKIEQLRIEEEQCIKERLSYYSFSIFVGWLSPQLILSLTFGLYVYLGHELVPSKVFPIISLINMLATSLSLLPVGINALIETQLSLKRIQDFLDTDEVMGDCISQYGYRDPQTAISIQQGTFFWNKKQIQENTAIPILNNISLTIEPGKFISIIGDVGSGKSSLMQSLLGEMIYEEGAKEPKITIYGAIAYVSQKAWIQNGTVRQNIIFGKDFKQELYDQAIYYSNLQQDINVLINGDQTMIGEKGINLSGGQKARISLARAIYSEANIFLLDDPLSAVDNQVGHFIMKECLLGYLNQKTRILITHALNYCKFTDYVYFLQKGEIIEQGEYTEMQNSIKFQEIEKKFSIQSQETEDSVKDSSKQQVQNEKQVEQIKIQTVSSDNLMLKEERQRGEIQTSVITQYFSYSNDMISYFLLIFIMVMWVVSQITSTLWIAEWSSKQSLQTLSNYTFFIVYFTIGLVQALFAYLRAMLTIKSSFKSSSKIHNEMVRCLFQAPLCQFFERVPLGRIMNRLTKDVNSLDLEIIMNISLFSTKLSQIVSNTILTLITSTYLLIFPMLIFCYICVRIQRLFMKASRELQRLELISRSPILSYFTETLSGLTTIRGYQQSDLFMNNFASQLDNNKQIVYQSTEANCWLVQILGFASLLVNMTAIAYCMLYTQNPGFAGLILTYASSLDVNVQSTIEGGSMLENNIISFERCLEFTKIPQEKQESTKKLDEFWPYFGNIKVQNLFVRYRDNLPFALKGLSVSISAREKIGVVGRTGAGKSSITLSLLRILEASEGNIFIDDVDISTLSLKQLRQQITTIIQDAIIFNGTIRQNLDPLERCSDDEILNVIKDCCLTTLLNERNGLDTQINEGGDNLSAGEKQLICIARAILKKSKIVLIDEATANIDIQTEEKIQQTIKTALVDCTVITIAHRINTILHCDKILVIDEGQLKEFGKTNDLLKQTDSTFYQIYKEAINQKL